MEQSPLNIGYGGIARTRHRLGVLFHSRQQEGLGFHDQKTFTIDTFRRLLTIFGYILY